MLGSDVDGVVSDADVSLVNDCITGAVTGTACDRADVLGDGTVDVTDAVYLVSIKTGSPVFPALPDCIIGYETLTGWLEVCGKGCTTEGMHCEQWEQSASDCAATCDAEADCLAFQAPDADNGFHGWCVWFEWVWVDPFGL